jgi:hypothetical protein
MNAISKIFQRLAITGVLFGAAALSWADGPQCGADGEPPCMVEPVEVTGDACGVMCHGTEDLEFNSIDLSPLDVIPYFGVDELDPGSCLSESKIDNSVKVVAFEIAILKKSGLTPNQCTQTFSTCVDKCLSATGVNWVINGVITSVGLAGNLAQQGLDRWSLGTQRALNGLRMCAAAGTWAGAAVGSYSLGATLGCSGMCAANRCHAM